MSRIPRRIQVLAAANPAIVASGNSGNLSDLSTAPNTEFECVLSCAGPVSGTSPSMTVSIYEIDPVTGLQVLLGSFSAVTGVLTNPLRLPFQSVFAQQIYVAWVVTGTNPSFGAVELDIYYTPDLAF